MSEANDGLVSQMLDDIAIVIAGKQYKHSNGYNRQIYQESYDRLFVYGNKLINREATFRSWKGSVDYQTKRREAYDEVVNVAINYGQKPEDACQSEEQPV
jgi:hypothetical protein